MSVISYPDTALPNVFTRDNLGWRPWIEPLAEADLTERHLDGLVEASRAKSPYFMLLARDPEILGARTRADFDIFYNKEGGLPRAERELSAAAVSRENGCIFCASVHARFAAHYSKREAEVDELLEHGAESHLDTRWSAIRDFAVALTQTPIALTESHVEDLRAQEGIDDLAVVDAIYSAAFFNWANRLMLSLGEPTLP